MTQNDSPAEIADDEKQTGRLEAFSDGIFGIAMTLLVLDLKVPHTGAGGTPANSKAILLALASNWPGYLAFVTSFVSVLIMWVHHHAMFRLVRRVDSLLLFANGFFLLLITVAPFPTAVVSEYLDTPAASGACFFYSGMLFLNSIAFFVVARVAFRPSMLIPNAPQGTLQRLKRSYRFGPPLYFLAMIAALFSPWLSMTICTALWVFWIITTHDCEDVNSGVTSN